MAEQDVPLTIADLKKRTQLIDPQGWIIVVEGANASGMCIVKPIDGSGPSTSVSITDLNDDGYKVHLIAEAPGSTNFYDIFDGLIIENKDGDRLTIRELAECKVVVESEKSNSTVTSLEDLKLSEYYLLKPEQVSQERIVSLNIEGRDPSFMGIASNTIEFGYSFLKFRPLSWEPDGDNKLKFEETDSFYINYERINNFCIYENMEQAEKVLLDERKRAKSDQ